MLYYKITNQDGKVWIMPKRNMRMGMMLYQPSAWKGWLLKTVFPSLQWCGILRRMLKIEKTACPLPEALQERLRDIFNCDCPEYSYFGGTPCVHQKATIQIYNGTKMLGYCKTTRNEAIYELFRHEQGVLDRLEEYGVSGVPRCLCCEKGFDDEYFFVQTTMKTRHSLVRHKFGALELQFLKQLADKTKYNCRFAETDQWGWLQRLQRDLWKLTPLEQNVITDGIKCVVQYFSDRGQCYFSAYHGDYTPWNMFVEEGQLFVFDFEYAGMRYIPYLDVLHYKTQTAIFEKGWGSEEIFNDYQLHKQEWISLFANHNIAYIAYLLDETAKFVCREGEIIPSDTQRLLNVWIPLMKNFLK